MIAGRRVLELGCGNGLASLAAARLGASQVLATDYRALPLSLVSSAARRAGCSPFELSTQVFDFASPMPPAAVVHTRSRASRIPPPEEPLPAHDILLAADIGYSPALAWRLGERCRESIAAGGRVLVAESRQNPACRAASPKRSITTRSAGGMRRRRTRRSHRSLSCNRSSACTTRSGRKTPRPWRWEATPRR